MGWPADTGAAGSVSVQSIRTVTASTAVTLSDAAILVDTSAGAPTLTLPAPSTCKGQRFTFKKISADANMFALLGGSIDGDTQGAHVMSQYEAVAVVSDGSAYFVLYRG